MNNADEYQRARATLIATADEVVKAGRGWPDVDEEVRDLAIRNLMKACQVFEIAAVRQHNRLRNPGPLNEPVLCKHLAELGWEPGDTPKQFKDRIRVDIMRQVTEAIRDNIRQIKANQGLDASAIELGYKAKS